ncbi:MAG: cache domain-containing protein, partial [Vallitaleaceae bacterium]|nr:cache domain-containing protein [Vallitaleaceae bacterium]
MKKVKLRVKVLLAFFVLIFTPLIILTSVTYSIVSKRYEEQILYAANQSFEQAVEFINNRVKSLIDASDIVYLNNEIQTILGRERSQIEGDLIQQYKDSLYLDNVLYSIQNNEDVFRIRLYVEDTLFYSEQSLNYSGLQQFMQSDKFKVLEQVGEKVVWFPPERVLDDGFESEVLVISMLRKVNNVEKITDFTGIIEIQVLEENILDIIRKANITVSGMVAIYNQRGESIAISDSSKQNTLDLHKILQSESKELWAKVEIQEKVYQVRR